MWKCSSLKGRTNCYLLKTPLTCWMSMLPHIMLLPRWLISHVSCHSGKPEDVFLLLLWISQMTPWHVSVIEVVCVLLLSHACSSTWSFCLGWTVYAPCPSGFPFDLSFPALILFPGALDFPTECQPHQTHAPHLHPRSGGHDPAGGPEWGRNP